LIQILCARSNDRDYAVFFGTPQESRPTKWISHDVGKAI